jgi:hypothetical protein
MTVETHTHHHVTCDLCAASQMIEDGGEAELRGWLIVALARPGHPGVVRTHACPDCAKGSRALSKLAEPLGTVPRSIEGKGMLS